MNRMKQRTMVETNPAAMAIGIFLICILSVGGCTSESAPITPGHTSFKVEMQGTDQFADYGASNRRMPDWPYYPFRLKITALDEKGVEIDDYSGTVRIKAMPGHLGLNGYEEVEIEDGSVLDLTLNRGYGDVKIWVEDVETLVTGVGGPLSLPRPTVKTAQTQVSDMVDMSVWLYENMRFEGGAMVVTHVTADGFYFSDFSLPAYNSLFVYTRNTPWLDRGDKLGYITGNVMEFFGTTQFSYSIYDVECSYYPIPEPTMLTDDMLLDDQIMESLEASLVTVSNVRIEPIRGDLDKEFSLASYGQYAVAVGASRLTINTDSAAPDFDPREHSALIIEKLTGMLKQHYSADPQWIVIVRDECDQWGLADRPDRCNETIPETTCDLSDQDDSGKTE